jgi:hypothetical protein
MYRVDDVTMPILEAYMQQITKAAGFRRKRACYCSHHPCMTHNDSVCAGAVYAGYYRTTRVEAEPVGLLCGLLRCRAPSAVVHSYYEHCVSGDC